MYNRRINHNQRNMKRRIRHGVTFAERHHTSDYSALILFAFLVIIITAVCSIDDNEILNWFNKLSTR